MDLSQHGTASLVCEIINGEPENNFSCDLIVITTYWHSVLVCEVKPVHALSCACPYTFTVIE